ncbi:beta-propeller domain-containing protein [bacterium]|nr:beta-propeller domain-containing protein [bacterium]
MSKFLKTLIILAGFALFFVACGSSGSNGSNTDVTDADNEQVVFDGDGNEEFITVGASSGDANKGGEDYAEDEATADAGDTEAPAGDDGGNAEREIVESDIYKFDGNVLWLANQHKGLIAVDIKDPEHLKILGTLKFQGYVGEMYLQEGRAYVLVSYTNSSYEYGEIYYSNKTYSKLMVVNTEDPENPELLGEFEIEGWITDSRQVGDVIYVASTEYTYYWYGCDGDEGYSGKDQISIMSINIKDPKKIKMVDKVDLDGYSYTLYVSQKSIYVAEADSYYWYEDYTDGYPITMFDISDPEGKIVKKAEFKTDGFMSDRWKMHEAGGKFFAVSSSSQWGNGDSFIESFDVSDPADVRRLDKLVFMRDQQLYGTKFEGDRMYAVTYFQQDPLHVIDISDPVNLKQLGELEVPGWSDFIEVRGTKILAVGRDNSRSKISMYDVSDPVNPKEINTVEVGSDYSYSEANYDWKAFKIFDELGLILLPITDYDYDSWDYTYKLYLVDFDLEKGLKTRGFIASDSYIRRGVAIQDLIFSIGENHLVTADASDRDKPKVLSELTLASDVSNVAKCGKSLCSLYGSQLSVYDKNNFDKLWESEPLDKYYYDIKMIKNSKYAYIYNYTHRWWNEYRYDDPYDEGEETGEIRTPTIKVIKFADNGKFEEAGDFPFNAKLDYEERVVSENNVIAAISWQEMIDEYEDEDEFDYWQRKIMFFDMNTPSKGIKETVLDFDYENLSYTTSIFVSGSTFWTSGCKLKKEDENGNQYLCYALSFDAGDPKNPKADKKVNIPGELVGISEDGKYLYTKTPEFYSYDVDEDSESNEYYWSNSRDSDFYILELNDSKTAVKVIRKEALSYSYRYNSNVYESVYDSAYAKNDKVFFVRASTGEEWNTCSYRTEQHYDVRIVSASDGNETFSKSFENANSAYDVNDGGILLSTHDGWRYIAPDGKEKSGNKNISSISSYNSGYYDSYYYYYNAKPQLIDGTVYVAADWDGIYSLKIK